MSKSILRKQLEKRARKTARKVVDNLEGRDECVACGHSGYVEVHHIDGDWLNNHPMNLVPLCYGCHSGEHRQRNAVARVQEMKAELHEITSQ